MVMITQEKTADARDHVLCVSFMKVGKLYYFDFDNFPDLSLGDRVIVQTRSLGLQMGEIKAFRRRDELTQDDELQDILRPATPADLLLSQQWKDREVAALIECREKAAQLSGFDGVKFVAAEYNYNGSVLAFLFTAEDKDKINTSKLRSILQRQLQTQVEFRQVGPRDAAKALEGFGACGIPRCCSTFLTDFSMISINMAKAQGISLNPSEITGMCGRLRCCLIYEYEQYVEARKQLPKHRKRIGTPHGEGRVIEVHPLRDGVTVVVDEAYHFVAREDIIPIAEYEALKEAAASPCSKSDSGGCDCGAKRPRGSAKELLEEIGIPADLDDLDDDEGEIPTVETAEQSEKTQPEQAARSKRRRGYRRGKRGGQNRQQKPAKGQGSNQ